MHKLSSKLHLSHRVNPGVKQYDWKVIPGEECMQHELSFMR